MSESEIISKDFLEKVLGKKVKSFTVQSHADTGDNFMSVVYTLDVQLEPHGELLHLFTKCYPMNPGRQEYLNEENVFWKELNFYKVWIPELIKFQEEKGLKEIVKPDFPIFVAGDTFNFDDDKDGKGKLFKTWDNYIMMVDLSKTRGFKMADKLLGLDKDHAALVVEAQAKMHALSWAYKQAKNITSIRQNFPFIRFDYGSPINRKFFQQLTTSNVPVAAEALKFKFGKDSPLIEALEKFAPKASRVMDIIYDYDGGETEQDLVKYCRVRPVETARSGKEIPWSCIIQSDIHLNNMMFRYNCETKKPEEVVLVDLQLCREACPIKDLVYLVYSSTGSEFRKNHLDEILKIYFEKFNHFCQILKCETLPGFTLEEVKYRFNRMKPFGLTMAMICSPILLKEKDESAVQLDSVEAKSQDEIFVALSQGMAKSPCYNKRITEMIQEMEAEGVI